MAKPFKKMQTKAQKRTAAWQVTEQRQSRNDFRPNVTGPTHKQHAPGSMNKKKLGLA